MRKPPFRVELKEKWVYKDRRPLLLVQNRLPPATKEIPHLVLRDAKGVPRFVLGYVSHGKDLTIRSVQRVRTEYDFKLGRHGFTKMPTLFSWNAEKETYASKQFQESLGKHPAEFLLSQFILQNREAVLKGAKIRLVPDAGSQQTWGQYMALVDRFFVRDPGKGFQLSMKKKRVRELLGLK